MHQEARARGHRDATVLDLRVPKESERLLAANACEAYVCSYVFFLRLAIFADFGRLVLGCVEADLCEYF